MCGGDLTIIEGNSLCECEFCGTQQTVPNIDNEKKASLFNRANRLRMNAEYDKAANIYSSIVAEFPEEAEAYWGLCLCKYGIEYVDDPSSGQKVPTCHRTLPDSILDDSDFDQACENADGVSKRKYREEAKSIDQLQKAILSIVSKEEPYDVFICYKETDENGDRTEDSVLAQDIYDNLTNKGLKVFFSRITLEDKLGQEYEPYIYAALHSAKVMIAVGTCFEYYDAVWVKNEWSRFLAIMKTDRTKTLIPCYKGLDAYDMPKEFKNLQAQDMGKLGWLQDLSRGILKLCDNDTKRNISKTPSSSPTVQSLLDRGFILLKDKKWNEASSQFNNVLNIEPKNARAYMGLLLEEMKFSDPNEFERAFSEGKIEYNSNLEHVREFDQGECTEWLMKLDYHRKEEIDKKEAEKCKTDKLITSGISSVNYSHNFTFGLKSDGTVLATNYTNRSSHNSEFDKKLQCLHEKVTKWDNITSIVCCNDALFGLKKDGTVVVEGVNQEIKEAVSHWSNVKSLFASWIHVIALCEDGSVYTTYAYDDPLDFDDSAYVHGELDIVKNWKNINKIFVLKCDSAKTIGIKNDGTVVCAGFESDNIAEQIERWKNIAVISIGNYGSHIIGLKNDGSLLAVGSNEHGECEVGEWRNIVEIATGYQHTVGLKSDGTVLAVGANDHNQCNISDWRGIARIYADDETSYGVKFDGTVVSTGTEIPWKHIIALPYIDSSLILGIMANGFVAASGRNEHGECEIDKWRLFKSINSIEQETENSGTHTANTNETVVLLKKESPYRPIADQFEPIITIYKGRILGVKTDGTVLIKGSKNDQLDDTIRSWEGIISIISDVDCIVGLKNDGTVVYVASTDDVDFDTHKWKDIRSIRLEGGRLIGLRSEGTVVVTGDSDSPCDISSWHDIIEVSTVNYNSKFAIFGLKKDGTVITTDNKNYSEVTSWRNIVALSSHCEHLVGLMNDGTVVATGNNKYGQCDVLDWDGIIKISAGEDHTLGLKADGSVVSVGKNEYSECATNKWSNIIDIIAGYHKSFGITSDGKVIAAGHRFNGACDVQDWNNIIAVYTDAGDTVGLRSDGTVIVVGNHHNLQSEIDDWKLFNDVTTLTQERNDYIAAIEEKRQIRREQRQIKYTDTAGINKKGDETSKKKTASQEQIAEAEQKEYQRKRLEERREIIKNQIANLRGLFVGKKRKELQMQLQEIEKAINETLN